MIDTIISKSEFTTQVQIELAGLLASAKAEYVPLLEDLSARFTEQYYNYWNAATESDRVSAENNIRHIKAAMAHISARMGLNLMERLLAICTTVLNIAATAAIRAII